MISKNRLRPHPGAHIIREDGQFPALQHVFQFFIGRGPAGCGENRLSAQGLGLSGALKWWDGAGTRESTLPAGLGQAPPPQRGRAWRGGVGQPRKVGGKGHTH